jgi:hypothetical protein
LRFAPGTAFDFASVANERILIALAGNYEEVIPTTVRWVLRKHESAFKFAHPYNVEVIVALHRRSSSYLGI